MGQMLGGLWGRGQGKQQVRRICDKVFNQSVDDNGNGLLALDNLYHAILLVYSDVNENFSGPRKKPPSERQVRDMEELLHALTVEELNRDQFYLLVLIWISKDLQLFVMKKFLLAFVAAPAMTMITKTAGGKVYPIQKVVDKISTPVFLTAYAVGFVLLQDLNISTN